MKQEIIDRLFTEYAKANHKDLNGYPLFTLKDMKEFAKICLEHKSMGGFDIVINEGKYKCLDDSLKGAKLILVNKKDILDKYK